MMHRIVKTFAFTLGAAVSLVPAAAFATACPSISAAPLNFGSAIVPGGAGRTINSSTTISVNCTISTPFSLLIGEGSHPSGAGMSAVRQLSGSSGTLSYGLFQDGSRSTPWGDGTNVGTAVSGFGDGTAQPFLVYASLTVPSATPLGSYSDSITVTVSF